MEIEYRCCKLMCWVRQLIILSMRCKISQLEALPPDLAIAYLKQILRDMPD